MFIMYVVIYSLAAAVCNCCAVVRGDNVGETMKMAITITGHVAKP